MAQYFLGIDIGSTKSHALIADESGRAIGFGTGGAGNYEDVGREGYQAALQTITERALESTGITRNEVAGAGFGISGYDWPSERELTLEGIASLGLSCPVEAVNDTIIGLKAGASQGWGIALVAGTGTNCCGFDQQGRYIRITGAGMTFGEFGGAIDIAWKALHGVGYAWTRRNSGTQLTEAFIQYVGAKDSTDLIEGLEFGRYHIGAEAAPLVFEVAKKGDQVARQTISWAGRELACSAIGVIRRLEFEHTAFEVVLVGSIFKGGPLLLDPMKKKIHKVAPGARFVHLTVPPVVGAVLLAME